MQEGGHLLEAVREPDGHTAHNDRPTVRARAHTTAPALHIHNQSHTYQGSPLGCRSRYELPASSSLRRDHQTSNHFVRPSKCTQHTIAVHIFVTNFREAGVVLRKRNVNKQTVTFSPYTAVRENARTIACPMLISTSASTLQPQWFQEFPNAHTAVGKDTHANKAAPVFRTSHGRSHRHIPSA